MTNSTTASHPRAPAACAVVDHFHAAEQARGRPFELTFVDPFTQRQADNEVSIPVRLLHDLREECVMKACSPDLALFVGRQQTIFEAWAKKQGLSLERTPTAGERFKQTLGGLHLATYLQDATEGAWRAWAHVAVQALQGIVPGEQDDAPAAADNGVLVGPGADEGWTSGYGLPSASKLSNDPNAGWTSGA